MAVNCSKSECTVGATGICLLNNEASSCEYLVDISRLVSPAGVAPVLQPPSTGQHLRPSLAMGSEDVNALASSRNCSIVGILGLPNAGKTAALVSLYLLISTNKLDGFEYRDSMSVMGLEQISRGARRWNLAYMPEQLTAHTEIADGRTAGFLHFRFKAVAQNRTLDVLMPDLPGEWTTALANSNRTDRLGFLKASTVLWYFINGRDLVDLKKRNDATHKAELVLKRVAIFLGSTAPPVTLVVTHKDDGMPDEVFMSNFLDRVRSSTGLKVSVVYVASFSETLTIAPGEGIKELIDGVSAHAERLPGGWPVSKKNLDQRAILNFRGDLS